MHPKMIGSHAWHLWCRAHVNFAYTHLIAVHSQHTEFGACVCGFVLSRAAVRLCYTELHRDAATHAHISATPQVRMTWIAERVEQGVTFRLAFKHSGSTCFTSFCLNHALSHHHAACYMCYVCANLGPQARCPKQVQAALRDDLLRCEVHESQASNIFWECS